MKNRKFKVKLFDGLERLSSYISNVVLDLYKQKGRLVLGVPWGLTPIPFFNSLSDLVEQNNINLSRMHLVMMDEYVSKDGSGYSFANQDAPYCGHYKIRVDLLEKLPAKEARNIQVHFPDPNNPEDFELLIKSLGGIDLFIVATGSEDGHVAMCGPDTLLDSRTGIIKIPETVREYNFKKYSHDFNDNKNNVPKYGVSVGLGTILGAKKLLFVAHGKKKSRIVEILFRTETFDKKYPVTFLWEAVEKSEIVIDNAAARNIASLIRGE